MSITVSYLVPSYNHERYVLAMLNSIKEDLLCLEGNAEIVIVDDASTDNSAALIKEWTNDSGKEISINFY